MNRPIKVQEMKLDNNLMYLIQHTTKQKTQDIMGYFLELAKDIAETKSNAWLNKSMMYQYPDTKIPYKIEVKGSYYDKHSSTEETDRPLKVSVTVAFPKKADYFDGSAIVQKLEEAFEASIGLTEEVEDFPPFPEPRIKIPTGVRKKRGIKYERQSKPKISTELVPACRSGTGSDARDNPPPDQL